MNLIERIILALGAAQAREFAKLLPGSVTKCCEGGCVGDCGNPPAGLVVTDDCRAISDADGRCACYLAGLNDATVPPDTDLADAIATILHRITDDALHNPGRPPEPCGLCHRRAQLLVEQLAARQLRDIAALTGSTWTLGLPPSGPGAPEALRYVATMLVNDAASHHDRCAVVRAGECSCLVGRVRRLLEGLATAAEGRYP